MLDGSTSGPPTHVTVAIIGAGFGGLGMAIRLQQSGIDDVLLLERGDAVGGTWRDNTYPGAACDIPSHLYSFSFELNPRWSHVYARQPEIRAYLEHCTDRYGLRDRIRLRAEVVEARFDPTTARWHLTTGDGQHVVARFVVHAVGGLKDPRYPEIPGLDRFEGPAIHSARWDHQIPLSGRRVGVIGTGASAIQIVPELAKTARALHVFQRTPPWVVARHDRAYTERQKRRFARFPAALRLFRWQIYARLEMRHPFVFGHDTGVGSLYEWRLRRQIRQAFDDPALAEALVPDYRLGCKRTLLSDDWYPALAQPHVQLHDTAIERIERAGVRLEGGHGVELDALVYCTGFTVDRPMGDMEIYGRDGRALSRWWGTRPRAYLGITVPRFPHAFILMGPNTALGHNSVILMIEAQIEYVRQAIHYVLQRPELAYVDVDDAALERFVGQIDRRHAGQVWQSGCRSWYQNADGINTTLWPGSTVEYFARTRRFDPGVYRKQRWGDRVPRADQPEASSSTPR